MGSILALELEIWCFLMGSFSQGNMELLVTWVIFHSILAIVIVHVEIVRVPSAMLRDEYYE